MTPYVGLDVHSKMSVYEVQDENGVVVSQGRVPTTLEGLQQLRALPSMSAGATVCLESGTCSFHVADLLQSLELRPVVVDAWQVRRFCSRPEQKSDRRDAHELATGLRTGKYTAIVAVPPPGIRELRETLSRRRHFVKVRTAQINAAKRLLRAVGRGSVARSLSSEKGWRALLEQLSPESRLRRHVGRHFAVWQSTSELVRELDLEIAELGKPWSQEIDRLMTAPGVGRIVASTFLAVVFDPHRFPSAKRLSAYIGLVPRTDQSGDRDRHGRITKKGSGELRAMLCEAAQHARRLTNPLNPYFQKVLHRRGYQMAIIAVAHRLARILWGMLRKRGDFEMKKAGVETGRFERVTTRRYRLVAAAN